MMGATNPVLRRYKDLDCVVPEFGASPDCSNDPPLPTRKWCLGQVWLPTSKNAWVYFASLSGFCYSVALCCLILFLNSPNQYGNQIMSSYLDANNYQGWFQYAVWRMSLLSDCYICLALGILFSALTFAWLPLKNHETVLQKIERTLYGSRIITILFAISIAILEIEFLAWAYELTVLLNFPSWSSFLHPFFELGNSFVFGSLEPNQDFPYVFVALFAILFTSIKFRSIWKTLQILSLSVVPLPVYVYLFDNREFFVHFEDQFKTFFFVTNFDIMVGSLAIFGISLLIERRKQVARRLGIISIQPHNQQLS